MSKNVFPISKKIIIIIVIKDVQNTSEYKEINLIVSTETARSLAHYQTNSSDLKSKPTASKSRGKL